MLIFDFSLQVLRKHRLHGEKLLPADNHGVGGRQLEAQCGQQLTHLFKVAFRPAYGAGGSTHEIGCTVLSDFCKSPQNFTLNPCTVLACAFNLLG
ncbi:hypothetical protein AZ20_4219 [Bordetella bronchiseptica E014]|nr:hypothetical protein AZ20_4219 [Bordetella bronchiseptica E014]KDC47963.1 hypothetical protein L509_4157 [Bordetella bronchiseptica M85/00/2]KDC66509.1 hypothetical protein L512_5231 [Bordetella bronchiseptica MBORD624]